MAESTVLVVDDEPRIVEFLSENLRDDDFSVLTAATGAEAIELLGRSRPDLILLDVVLPDMSGYEICRTVRAGDGINDPWDPDLPIIMLSAKAEHVDRVRGLVRGADDYVTKPFHYPELLARIGAILARVSRSRDREVIRHGDLTVNTLSREVTVGGIKVDLSAKDYSEPAPEQPKPEKSQPRPDDRPDSHRHHHVPWHPDRRLGADASQTRLLPGVRGPPLLRLGARRPHRRVTPARTGERKNLMTKIFETRLVRSSRVRCRSRPSAWPHSTASQHLGSTSWTDSFSPAPA